MEDPEYPGKTSDRKDQRDLLADWTAKPAHKLLIDREGFEAQDFHKRRQGAGPV
jgi:alkaline phosphatase